MPLLSEGVECPRQTRQISSTFAVYDCIQVYPMRLLRVNPMPGIEGLAAAHVGWRCACARMRTRHRNRFNRNRRKGYNMPASPDIAQAGDQAGRSAPPPDRLNETIGVLTRREVEARILAPLIDALGREFGHERVREIVRAEIVQIARRQGEALAATMEGDSLGHFADSMRFWTMGGALEIEVLEQTDEVFDFNVTRCRYAELYQALGLADLGFIFSCNRDYALIEGFNPDIELTRTMTIMEGAPHCAFRYRRRVTTASPIGGAAPDGF